MKKSVTVCDRCGKEISYIGWTGIIKMPIKREFFIRKIFNGNPSGYDYSDNYGELCAECMESFRKWYRGEISNDKE